MRKKDLIKQLNRLKEQIKPDQKWQVDSREILLNQIQSQTQLDFNSKTLSFNNLFPNYLLKPVLKSTVSLVFVLALIFTTWTASVGATRNSMPGDLLYNLKLTTERVQVNLALNDEKKANLEIEFAQRRLDEINQIRSENASDQDLGIPLKKFEESMVNVKSSLVKLEKKDKKIALKIASLVDQKTQQYVDLLEDHQVQKPELAGDTEEVISTSKKLANKALSIIIAEYESGESEITQEEIMTKVGQKIDDVQNDLHTKKQEIDLIIANYAKEQAQDVEALSEESEDKEGSEGEEGSENEESSEGEEAGENEESSEGEEVGGNEDGSEGEEDGENEAGSEDSEEVDEVNEVSEVDEDDEVEEVDDGEVNEELVEGASVDEIMKELLEQRSQALILLADANNLIKGGQISQAFDKVKKADDILSDINKTVLANIKYLNEDEDSVEEDGEGLEDSNTSEEVDEVSEVNEDGEDNTEAEV